jgi:hypothetical protein
MNSHDGLEPELEPSAPQAAGPLVVLPLISRAQRSRRYLAFAEAMALGLSVTEIPEIPSVGALWVRNPLTFPVLLYGGEEVLGARQNRVFETTMLVGAASTQRVPVACVEAGRWDPRGDGEPMSPSPQAASPRLRAIRRAASRRGRTPRGDAQKAIWEEIDEIARRHSVSSSSRSMHDVYEARRERLDVLAGPIVPQDGQVGALVAIGGRFVVLDYVSDPAAWSALARQLVQGYALDALDARELDSPSDADAREFLDLLWRAPRRDHAAAGIGRNAQFDFGRLAGSDLSWEDETIAATAFAAEARSRHHSH